MKVEAAIAVEAGKPLGVITAIVVTHEGEHLAGVEVSTSAADSLYRSAQYDRQPRPGSVLRAEPRHLLFEGDG